MLLDGFLSFANFIFSSKSDVGSFEEGGLFIEPLEDRMEGVSVFSF
jgi:hypothetical protein